MKWKCRKLNAAKTALKTKAIDNIFTEFEYIANNHACAKDMAQVHNLVGTSRIFSKLHKLDLRAISNLLPNAYFEKQKFAAITIRLGEPVCTVLLFTSGKMVLTGCKSFMEVLLASMNCLYALRMYLPGVRFELCDIAIQNIVGNADLKLQPGEKLDLNAFYQDHNVYCTYQPTMFPGLIYRPVHVDIVVLLFFSGRVVLTGARTMSCVYGGWNQLYTLIKQYKRKASELCADRDSTLSELCADRDGTRSACHTNTADAGIL
jgi:transcription initiation factor TFIID TATA-box-binding protein